MRTLTWVSGKTLLLPLLLIDWGNTFSFYRIFTNSRPHAFIYKLSSAGFLRLASHEKLIVIRNAKFQTAVGVVFKRFDLCQLERCRALRLLGYCPTEGDYPGPWFLPRYMSTATNGNQIRVDLLVQERKKCFPFAWRRWIVQGLCLLRFWNRKPHYQS